MYFYGKMFYWCKNFGNRKMRGGKLLFFLFKDLFIILFMLELKN